MFSAFQTFGKLGAIGKAIASAWSPLALWPDGVDSPGMWIDPSLLTASFNDYTGTTPVATPGTVADSTNPVGLALDIRAGATVLTDPGNHMLQATSAARPLESARVNLFVYSEQMDSTEYVIVSGGAYLSNATMPGYLSAKRYEDSAGASDIYFIQRYFSFIPNTNYFMSVDVQFDDGQPPVFGSATDSSLLNSFVVAINGSIAPPLSYQVVPLGSNIYRVIASINSGAGVAANCGIYKYATNQPRSFVTSGWNLSVGSYSGYQKVIGSGSTYDATGITPFQLYDGTDDGMATASFAAGTLINGMDCMIAVRRSNNLLPQILGLYQADQTKYFGVVGETSPNTAGTFGGCGTPTIFVNNVETANTRGDLFDAMPFGEWFILEYRGLDLSAWVNANFGNYGLGYSFKGDRGDILLYPSTASTSDKDAARQYLADKYGVTLP